MSSNTAILKEVVEKIRGERFSDLPAELIARIRACEEELQSNPAIALRKVSELIAAHLSKEGDDRA